LVFSPLQVFRSNNPVIRFFASVKLTVVLLIVIAMACIIGTLIPQADAVPGTPETVYAFYVKSYGPRLHVLFNILSLYQLYSSWWFSLLLLVLTVNMIVCGLRRLRRHREQVGFQLTHLSIVFLLAGVLIGLNAQEGQMRILEGEQSDIVLLGRHSRVADTLEQARQLKDEMETTGSQPLLRLTFALYLNDFEIRRQQKPLDSLLVQLVRGGPISSYNIAFQRKVLRAAGEPWDIEVLETMPVQHPMTRVIERDSGTTEPAVELEISGQGHRHTGWVFARGPHQRLELTDDSEIVYRRCRWRQELDRVLGEKTLPATTTTDCIEVARSASDVTTLPLRIGVDQLLPDSSVTLTVLRFVPDWKMDPGRREVYSASDERRNPAVQIRLKRGGASEVGWLFSRFPTFHGQAQFGTTSATLRFVEADLHKALFLRILAADGSDERYVQRYENGQLVETTKAASDRPVLLSDGVELRIVRWFEHAAMESREEEDPDNFAARLRVRDRNTGQTEKIETESGEVMARGRLHFVLQREYPIDQYISHVRVVENGQPVVTKAIQMNDPLKYKGYTFYQSSYESEAGDASRYSILSVKRDPGVWFVYLGFGMLTLGLVVVFYVNPWLRKRTLNAEC